MRNRCKIPLLLGSLVFTLIVGGPGVSGALPTDDLWDFRYSHWGMRLDEVIAVESEYQLRKAPLSEPGSVMLYSIDGRQVGGHFTKVQYHFREGLLSSAAYSMYTNPGKCVREYEDLRDLLTQKYGTPTRDTAIWDDTEFQGSREQWPLAVRLGHVQFVSGWESPRTTVTLVLGNTIVRYTISPEGITEAEWELRLTLLYESRLGPIERSPANPALRGL